MNGSRISLGLYTVYTWKNGSILVVVGFGVCGGERVEDGERVV